MSRARCGDKVWVEGKKQPNGVIAHIDWHDKEVYVECYDTHKQVVIDFDNFTSFNDRLNQWVIHEGEYNE